MQNKCWFIFALLACFHCAAYAASDADVARTISGNPASVNIFVGTAKAQAYLEKKLAIKNDYGIRIGGMLMADTNDLFSGGIPHGDQWTNNGLFLLDLSVDTEKSIGIKGGLFDVQIMQFNGQNTNQAAGSVQGYNSLPGAPPLNRFQLYQLWYRQELFEKKLIIRLGKTAPTFEFNNVSKPISLDSGHPGIDAITSLIYTPIFVNASLLGVLPGFYNTAYGATISVAPVNQWYLTYGIYDGALAQGIQTGLTGPIFNHAYFNIAETGFEWLIGKNKLPGNFGIGAWRQTGLIKNFSGLTEHGTSGYYFFGTQRLWYQHPTTDSSGITAFYQFGKNNSGVLSMTKYIGGGLSGYGLVPSRLYDSMGLGFAYSWLNQHSFIRQHELMYQLYYQAQVINQIFYLEPVLTYIPTPGDNTSPKAWAGTLRGMLLF